MACLITLKLEIKTLEKTFTRAHERFQIINASVDELTCRFIGRNGKKFDIHANITVSFLIFLNFFCCNFNDFERLSVSSSWRPEFSVTQSQIWKLVFIFSETL